MSFDKELPKFRNGLLKFLITMGPENRGNKPLLNSFSTDIASYPRRQILSANH